MKIHLFISLVFIFFSSAYSQNYVKKVACIGNSITEGYGRENSNSYPNQLNVLLGSEYEVRNFGVGGRTMLKNGDFPYWEEIQFEMAQDFEPDIVIILLGTNDSKPQNWAYKDKYYSDYADMVTIFRNLNQQTEIFVGFPPPVFQSGYGINDSIIHQEIIPLIDLIRTRFNTFHINFYDTMTEMGDLFPDGIHPDAAGYGEMARIAAEALLNRPPGVITYFYADPTVVEEDESSVLYWKASDSSMVTLDGQPVEIKDSLSISPTESKEYTLITSGQFHDTSRITVSFLPSGLIKSFYTQPWILEKDSQDSAVLYWETTNNSQVSLDDIPVTPDDSLVAMPDKTTTFTLIAEGAVKDTSQVTIQVLDADQINRSLLAVAYDASSTKYRYSVESAFDNDTSTYWLSEGHNAEWISVDLGRELYLNRIVINWGAVFATLYRIEVMDEQNQQNIFSFSSSGSGGTEDISGEPVKGRLIRMLCLQSSSSERGYEINEFEIYGSSDSLGTALEMKTIMPDEFELFQNYPNPFNPVTTIRYIVGMDVGANNHSPLPVELSICNIIGQKITTLVSEKQAAGIYTIKWDARTHASGFYFYRLKSGSYKKIKRMLIIK